MDTNNEKVKSLKAFLKKYGYYFVLIACVLALALIITLASLTDQSYGSVDVGTNNVEFLMPVANTEVLADYSDTELFYNETLRQWEAHMGIDFGASEGALVVAAYDGTVSSVYSNTLEGTVVVLDHGNGLQTFYSSLDSSVEVNEGDTVKKGDTLGKVSDSATR